MGVLVMTVLLLILRTLLLLSKLFLSYLLFVCLKTPKTSSKDQKLIEL